MQQSKVGKSKGSSKEETNLERTEALREADDTINGRMNSKKMLAEKNNFSVIN